MINVTKRNGSVEPLDLNKFHRVVSTACEGLTGVSPSYIELKSHVQFYDKIKTSDVQETLIRAAAELITEDTPNYQYVASRLINYDLRKRVWGTSEPEHLSYRIHYNVSAGYYDPDIVKWYSDEELEELNKHPYYSSKLSHTHMLQRNLVLASTS
mgnify:CR=1 FL=1